MVDHAKQAQHTVQKFYLVVNLVQKKTIDELVKTRMASVISKDQVRRESEKMFASS